MRFSRQEYWSGLPFSSPKDLLNPGIEPRSPVLQADSLPSKPPGKQTRIIKHPLPLTWAAINNNLGKGKKMERERSVVLAWRTAEKWMWKKNTEKNPSALQTTLLALFSSVAQLCLTLCNPMDCSTPGFHVLHQLPELAQTHVHQVGDAIQPPYPLSSPSPPAFNLSQHHDLFQWNSSLHQVAKVLEFQYQHQSFQWIFRTDSFRIDWFHLHAVQGTLKSLLQHHSSKASVLRCLAFFMV